MRKHNYPKLTAEQKTEYFKCLGSLALIRVLEGKLTPQKANSVLRFLRKLYDNHTSYDTIKKYLYRSGLLNKDQIIQYK